MADTIPLRSFVDDPPLERPEVPWKEAPTRRKAPEMTTPRMHQGDPKPSPPPAIDEPLLVDIPRLAPLTCLSERHLRRLDSSRDIPGRIVSGRRVLFAMASIRQWIALGLPDRERFEILTRQR